MMRIHFSTLVAVSSLLLLGQACTSNQDQFSNSVEIESMEGVGKTVEAQAQQGSSAKVENGYSLEWFSCTRNVKAPFIVMLNRKDAVFSGDTCKTGLAQAFLQQDFNVLAVNRPGAGKSEGKEIIGDDQSLASLKGLLKDQIESGKVLAGLWGFEDASVLALRAARAPGFQFLIIGNGVYDWEATLNESKDPAFVADLKELQKGQDATFVEKRSIAWDFNGLPKTVYLYHTVKDAKYPETQAEAFRAALAANQYNVQLIKAPSETGVLTPVVHQSVLIQIAQSIKTPAESK
ncbi:MAG: hypothetical protein V4655_04920 [Bdellovibrionota bacterium]|nr:MAG: hypothetical protein EOP10_24895 [Pseudomonadota bacterium]